MTIFYTHTFIHNQQAHEYDARLSFSTVSQLPPFSLSGLCWIANHNGIETLSECHKRASRGGVWGIQCSKVSYCKHKNTVALPHC